MNTIKIKPSHPSQGDFVVINEGEFDPELHEMFGAEEAEPQDAEASAKRKYTRKPRADAQPE